MTIDLSRFPRVKLAHLPTPLEELETLGRDLDRRIFCKRDDCTGLAIGGNKTRKLEFTLADAIEKGACTIVTSGGLQSNHVRQTAAAAAKLGLACHAVLNNPLADPPAAYRESGNLLLDSLFSVVIHEVEGDQVDAKIAEITASLTGEGRKPYVVPMGASHGIGALGYVECAQELIAQCEDKGIQPSHVFLTTGSAGTHGGFLAGLRLLGSPVQVVGISVSEDAPTKRAKVQDIIDQVAEVMETNVPPVRDNDIVVLDDYVGDGYGVRTEAAEGAIRRLARTEGLLLDPVYTGKAMAGMLDLLENNKLEGVQDPVFLHTGGSPALFAYP